MKPNDNSNQENKNSMTQNEPNGENSSYISDKYSVTEKNNESNQDKTTDDLPKNKYLKTEKNEKIKNKYNEDFTINSARKELFENNINYKANNYYNNFDYNLNPNNQYTPNQFQDVIIVNDLGNSNIKKINNKKNHNNTANIPPSSESYICASICCNCCFHFSHYCCFYACIHGGFRNISKCHNVNCLSKCCEGCLRCCCDKRCCEQFCRDCCKECGKCLCDECLESFCDVCIRELCGKCCQNLCNIF